MFNVSRVKISFHKEFVIKQQYKIALLVNKLPWNVSCFYSISAQVRLQFDSKNRAHQLKFIMLIELNHYPEKKGSADLL
jgi:hypothetical protein